MSDKEFDLYDHVDIKTVTYNPNKGGVHEEWKPAVLTSFIEGGFVLTYPDGKRHALSDSVIQKGNIRKVSC